jgi:4-carboxymuconolactone decarboxylase
MKIFQIFVTMTAIFLSSGYINAQNMETTVPEISAFPTGKPNVAYEQYFSGRSWLAPLTSMKELNVPVSNVTFEPGCRNNWHSHTGGQLLVCVGGEGYYQEKGKPARRLKAGDVVEIAPDVVHWHGAAPDSWFSHLAVECNPQTNKNTWLSPVTDEEYAEAVKHQNQ